MDTNNLVRIAKVGRPRGLKGEFGIVTITDIPEIRFKKHASIFIDNESYKIENSRFIKDRYYIKLEGLNSIEEVETLKNKEVFAEKIEEEGKWYISDLLDKDVFENDNYLGKVTNVLITKFQTTLEYKNIEDEKEYIPITKEWIEEVGPDKIKVTRWD